MPSAKWIDFRTIRQNLSIETVLQHYGVQLRRTDPHTLRGKCPLPGHTSKEASSFIVDTQKNVWSCHSDSCAAARDGRIGGNALDFVTAVENCSLREAALKITSWFSVQAGIPPAEPPPERISKEGQGSNPPLRFALSGIDPTHAYVASRNITAETAAAFGVGFYSRPGTLTGRVVIPIHSGEGKLVAYAGRAIDGAEPKYRFPKGFKKSLELFNLHRVIAAQHRGVIVVEGFFDCMTVHQAGFPNVVALMGSTLAKPQERSLLEHFAEVALMLDGDRPGREATNHIAAQLAGKIALTIITVPDGKQPDQMTAVELRSLLGRQAAQASRRMRQIPEGFGEAEPPRRVILPPGPHR